MITGNWVKIKENRDKEHMESWRSPTNFLWLLPFLIRVFSTRSKMGCMCIRAVTCQHVCNASACGPGLWIAACAPLFRVALWQMAWLISECYWIIKSKELWKLYGNYGMKVIWMIQRCIWKMMLKIPICTKKCWLQILSTTFFIFYHFDHAGQLMTINTYIFPHEILFEQVWDFSGGTQCFSFMSFCSFTIYMFFLGLTTSRYGVP